MNRANIYKKYCIGCGLCAVEQKESILENERGYLGFAYEPNHETVSFCDEVCPVSGKTLEKLNENKIWGEEKGIFLGYATDQEVRKKASSGGVLTGIAIYLLESSKVDGILHVCENEKYPLGTITCLSTKREEVILRSGSRYAISHPLFDMWKMLQFGKKYCFIGKPCDVAALRNYIDKGKAKKEQFPYIFSFFCAGLPSKQANEQLLSYMGCSISKCQSLTYRGNGWPGVTSAIDDNGAEYSLDYGTAWGKILGRDIHPFCRFCMDGIGERADISCGDAWYLNEKGQPDFSENEGRNIIFARNGTGKKILQNAQEAGYIEMIPLESEEYIKKVQNYQFVRRATMYSKVIACKMLGYSVPYAHLGKIKRYGKYAGKKEQFKIFKGTVKRVVTKKM